MMIALVATTVLALLVAACGGSTSTTTTTSTTPAPAEVTVALDWTPNTNHVGIYVAEALGYYKAAGLTVKLLPYAETAPETLVSKGIADFGFSYANGIAFARASDLDVVQVFANISKQQYQLAYRADDPSITSPKDLDGKTYAGFGTPSENSEVTTIIQADGGTGKVKKIVLNTSAYEAVYNGSADFTISANTWEGVEAKVNGKPMKYFNPEDYGYPANYSSAIISSNAWLKANPDVAKCFLAATTKGYAYASEHPQEAAKLLLAANPQTLKNPAIVEQSMAMLAGDGYLTDTAGHVGVVDPAMWTTFGDYLYDHQVLTDADGKPVATRPDWSTFYTNDYLPKP